MSFSTMLAEAGAGDTVIIPAGWGQGRATFGGVVAALLFEHLRVRLGDAPPLRSLTVSFVAPVAPGAVTLQADILRRGKSVVQAEARLMQGDDVAAVALASFGAGRESVIQVMPAPMAAIGRPEDGEALPWLPGVTPDFTRHFDFRTTVGTLPFKGSATSDLGGWMRFREQTGAASVAHLLALVDAWPPAVLQMFTTVAPISTLSWTIEFLGDAGAAQAGDWWGYLADTDVSGDGYAHIRARLWDASGRLVALSRQTVAVFA